VEIFTHINKVVTQLFLIVDIGAYISTAEE